MYEVRMGWLSTRSDGGDFASLNARTGQKRSDLSINPIAGGRCRALGHEKRKIKNALPGVDAEPRLRKQCGRIRRCWALSTITQVSELQAPEIRSGGLTLEEHSNSRFPVASRDAPPAYTSLDTFELPKGADRHYVQQYADMYYLRLVQLKPAVEKNAAEQWNGYTIGGEKARQVERVLDVRQGELCWVVGTVFMEMPLKPRVLDDISKEHWISAPPPREKYISPDGGRQVMLEDESGRLRLAGRCLENALLVTGAIIAAIGTETSDGVFDVLEIKVADLPRQPERWELEDSASAVAGTVESRDNHKGSKIALVSGLQISGDYSDALQLDLLADALTGQLGNSEFQADMAGVSRLIIAGDSLANACPIPSREELAATKKDSGKKYGYDSASYNAAPTSNLDDFLESILPTIAITLLPGQTDPANVQIPQQPMHAALFPQARLYAKSPAHQGAVNEAPSLFDPVTNPWEGEVEGWRFLGNGGQPVSDVFKYVESDDRLDMMESMLRWRCNAPTAPDTLWCYPFQDDDPLLIKECPHVYFAGNQPSYGTRVIEGPAGQLVRLIAVPKFKDTGSVVVIDSETLEVKELKVEI
ncbi:dna polymerase delta subunit 2 [Diplodia corticola]|uniref:DNA-directed DNA polymerase n=1 Tax=Diplodia corticola TaxID=236234 RepID=A0A1J9RY82_9PEZI|nr:dna polymerase delta subunit 2 [Diplodia corticola]OJD32413.1 dna polymerase delta subunit 2 [Diplodia corticola]